MALLASSRSVYAINNTSIASDIPVQLTGSGLTVTLAAGSTLVSFSAGSATLTLNLDPTSNVTIKSTDLFTLTNSQSLPTLCSGTSYSYVNFTSTSTQAVTLTPSATVACTGGGGGGGGGGGSVVVLPTISSFSASPASILFGQSSALFWNLTGASRISITPAVSTGTLNSLSGTATTTPATTTTYTLTAFNIYSQSVSTTTTVTVSAGNTASSSLPTSLPPVAPTSAVPAYCLVNNAGTFYLILNGIRHGITDPGILYSYGYGFSSSITDTTFYQQLPTGNLLLPNDGALAKTSQNPTVYLIADQQRHGFTSASVFLALGFKFSSVLVVTAPELDALPMGDVIASGSSRHLRGVNVSSSGTVLFMDDNSRSPYPSLAVYNSWNLQNNFSTVVPANSADLALPVGPNITARSSCGD
jgi:hypothetical protein